MKTLQQIKDDVAKKYGYADWHKAAESKKLFLFEEVCTEYNKALLANEIIFKTELTACITTFEMVFKEANIDFKKDILLQIISIKDKLGIIDMVS